MISSDHYIFCVDEVPTAKGNKQFLYSGNACVENKINVMIQTNLYRKLFRCQPFSALTIFHFPWTIFRKWRKWEEITWNWWHKQSEFQHQLLLDKQLEQHLRPECIKKKIKTHAKGHFEKQNHVSVTAFGSTKADNSFLRLGSQESNGKKQNI